MKESEYSKIRVAVKGSRLNNAIDSITAFLFTAIKGNLTHNTEYVNWRNPNRGETCPNPGHLAWKRWTEAILRPLFVPATSWRCMSRRNSVAVVVRLWEIKAFHVFVLGGYALHLNQSVLFES